MPESSEANSTPDHPPLKLAGSYLAVASPTQIAEACFSVPAIRAIRNSWPQGTIVVFSPENIAPLWETVPEIDQVITYSDSASNRKISNIIKSSGVPFDCAIVWEESPASMAFAKMQIPQRLGPDLPEINKWTTEPVQVVEEIGPIKHRVRYYLLFVEKLGAAAFIPENFQAPPRPEQPEMPRVVLVPGSDFGTSAMWSIDRFAIIAQAIIDNGTHDLYILATAKGDRAYKLGNLLNGRFKIFEEDLTDTIELLSTSEALIGNDSSLPHLAAHVGTQCVVIFGPNEPEWKRPRGKQHRAIREQVPCSPCLLDKCPLDHRCMEEITVERVLAALETE